MRGVVAADVIHVDVVADDPAGILDRFHRRQPVDALLRWHRFEEDHPDQVRPVATWAANGFAVISRSIRPAAG